MEKDIKIINFDLTPSELEEVEKAKTMPITYDEDCPETTPEMAMHFHRVNPLRKAMS